MAQGKHQYVKLPIVVAAERTWIEVELLTREGLEQAKAGDWIVTGGGGERWPMSNSTFIERYNPIEGTPGKFLAKPITVSAEQLEAPLVLDTKWGQQSAVAGDWLITSLDGSQHVCDAEAFARTYKSIEIEQ